jgi:hypothetical protein
MSLISRRIPFSIAGRFEGDFNKWYPLHRQVPVIVRMMTGRDAAIAKAERLLPLRFSDAPENVPQVANPSRYARM